MSEAPLPVEGPTSLLVTASVLMLSLHLHRIDSTLL